MMDWLLGVPDQSEGSVFGKALAVRGQILPIV